MIPIHPDLYILQKTVYEPAGLILHTLTQEAEGQDYSAATFCINETRIIFRRGKIMPQKSGFFVTLWKREAEESIAPYTIHDPYDCVIISARSGERFGQFIFPLSVLSERGVISSDRGEGKLALRVYAPWDTLDSEIAQKSQLWQSRYFFEVGIPGKNLERIKKLFA
jgi:hypothetical protein